MKLFMCGFPIRGTGACEQSFKLQVQGANGPRGQSFSAGQGIQIGREHFGENMEVFMADLTYRNEALASPWGCAAWGAIWAGMFSFIAIWSVFGMLGEAIFASSANPNAAQPVSGMSVGMAFWSVILTIIAMYVAGRVTAHLSGVIDRTSRIMQGMTMFGLSVMAVIATLILGGTALSGASGLAGGTHSPYMLTIFSDVGWIGFACLFLGWLAAMGGAAQQNVAKSNVGGRTGNVQGIRPAA